MSYPTIVDFYLGDDVNLNLKQRCRFCRVHLVELGEIALAQMKLSFLTKIDGIFVQEEFGIWELRLTVSWRMRQQCVNKVTALSYPQC